ncbi:MAG: hypothetical protein M3347_14095 [Armatimonadota bacterium]|nr:hypothetical protein [Armatimonadota bacterium]
MQDSILFWNAVALEANRVSHTEPGKKEQAGPPLSARALAIVHLAMYDAYAGVVGGAGFPRYLQPPNQPAHPAAASSARDAVAGAAFTTLSSLYKTQVDFFEAQLSAFNRFLPNGQPDPSFQFGVDVAKALLALRMNDPDVRDGGYMPSSKRGRHRRDPTIPNRASTPPFTERSPEALPSLSGGR